MGNQALKVDPKATKYCHGQPSSESWPKGQRNIAMGNQALKVDPKGNKILPWATKLWKLNQGWFWQNKFIGNIEVAISRFSYLLFVIAWATPPLWTDLVKISSRKLRHASFFSAWSPDFKNVIFENIHWAHSEDAEVAEVKRPRNPKWQKF